MTCLSRVWFSLCVCFALAFAAPAMAQCNPGKIELPDLNLLKLSAGEHVLGTLETAGGKLEARVTVKDNNVSDPTYTLAGKKLEKTANKNVEKENRACLKKKRISDIGAWSTFANAAMDFIITPAEARQRRCVIVGTSCNNGQCCAAACCGNICAIECANF